MIINGKKSSEAKSETEMEYYFSVVKGLLFETERQTSFISNIKMKRSKSTDSLYAVVYFKNQFRVLKLTIRNHPKKFKDDGYCYFLDNYDNTSELLLTFYRDFQNAYTVLNRTGLIPKQNPRKEAYNSTSANRMLGKQQKKKNKKLQKRRSKQ